MTARCRRYQVMIVRTWGAGVLRPYREPQDAGPFEATLADRGKQGERKARRYNGKKRHKKRQTA